MRFSKALPHKHLLTALNEQSFVLTGDALAMQVVERSLRGSTLSAEFHNSFGNIRTLNVKGDKPLISHLDIRQLVRTGLA